MALNLIETLEHRNPLAQVNETTEGVLRLNHPGLRIITTDGVQKVYLGYCSNDKFIPINILDSRSVKDAAAHGVEYFVCQTDSGGYSGTEPSVIQAARDNYKKRQRIVIIDSGQNNAQHPETITIFSQDNPNVIVTISVRPFLHVKKRQLQVNNKFIRLNLPFSVREIYGTTGGIVIKIEERRIYQE